MLLSISIVILGASDMDKSITFYRDKLGLKLTSQNADFAFFDAGGTTLALSRAHAQHSSSLIGATEVVFGVEGVKTEYDKLKKQGVKFVDEPHEVKDGEEWTTSFTDPDGHMLSIFGPP
jgi:catechol 2,3-dioxygenase-like lactoylglutathione lyase family enzyme